MRREVTVITIPLMARPDVVPIQYFLISQVLEWSFSRDFRGGPVVKNPFANVGVGVGGAQVWSLIWEDATCLRATKPVCNHWACVLQLLNPTRLEPELDNKGSHHKDKPTLHNPALCN